MILTADKILHGAARKIETKCVVIEEGCLKNFKQILKANGLNGAVAGIFDTNTICAHGMVAPEIEQIIVLNAEGLHADEKAVEETLSQLKDDVRIIAAFGSGTVTDVARYCANLRNLTFVSCPTAASVDGFCSSVCAMTFNGTKMTLPAVAPKIVIADISVIKNAPERLVKSGLGDILGKYVSLADWKIASLVSGETYCESTAQLVRNALTAVTDIVEEGVFQGNEFYERVIYALLLSGIAMQSVGSSRPASGAEHHVSHLLTVAPLQSGIRTDALHGESVGVGTIYMAQHYRKIVLQSGNMLPHRIADGLKRLRENDGHLKDDVYFRDNFGEIASAISSENAQDCLLGIDTELLRNNWQTVIQSLECIPSYEELNVLFKKLGMKRTLRDLGVEESKKSMIIELSPFIRNRLTFNRLLLLTHGI